jgi:hypothetical protein
MLGLVAVACSSKELDLPQAAPTRFTEAPEDGESDGGGAHPAIYPDALYYPEGVLVAPGEYRPPSAENAAQEKWEALLPAEEGKPVFEGDVNGLRLVDVTNPSIPAPGVCAEASQAKVDWLNVTHLPPGTKAYTPPVAVYCEDGSIGGAYQEFSYTYGSIGVAYWPGDPIVYNSVSADRVEAGTIQGRPAVFMKPLIEEGTGAAALAFLTDRGFILLQTTYLPLDQMIKIAEGITCGEC